MYSVYRDRLQNTRPHTLILFFYVVSLAGTFSRFRPYEISQETKHLYSIDHEIPSFSFRHFGLPFRMKTARVRVRVHVRARARAHTPSTDAMIRGRF